MAASVPTPKTTIEITVSTWQALNARKQPGDSFDDVIRQLLQRQSDSGHADHATIATTDPTATTDTQPPQPPQDGSDQLDVPDSVPARIDSHDAHSAIQAACEHVHEEGRATKKEIVRAVMPAHPLGYEVPELESGTRFRGAWWRKIIKPGLDQAPNIKKPAQHESDWQSQR